MLDDVVMILLRTSWAGSTGESWWDCEKGTTQEEQAASSGCK